MRAPPLTSLSSVVAEAAPALGLEAQRPVTAAPPPPPPPPPSKRQVGSEGPGMRQLRNEGSDEVKHSIRTLQRENAEQLELELESQQTFEHLNAQLSALRGAFSTLSDVLVQVRHCGRSMCCDLICAVHARARAYNRTLGADAARRSVPPPHSGNRCSAT